jgi:D-alanine-D-alanine ligase
MKKNIAILTGGDTAERIISLKSAAIAQKYLQNTYNTYTIDIQGSRWQEIDTHINIDKNDFSLTKNGNKIRFDAAFAALHGAPLENGKLQGYLEMMGVPYTCCDGYTSALTMHKHNTKTQLAPYAIPMAKSVLLHKNTDFDIQNLLNLGLPMFVKPNGGGSSFGVTKVKNQEELLPAIAAAFAHDTQVLVESFMQGREFSNGVIPQGDGKVLALPITEIVPETEFFDFAAKYEGKSKEITPANLTPAQTTQCQNRSVELYNLLGCKGFVRFDYILVGEVFMFLEANTIPGMTEASLLPQQAQSAGIALTDLFVGAVQSILTH